MTLITTSSQSAQLSQCEYELIKVSSNIKLTTTEMIVVMNTLFIEYDTDHDTVIHMTQLSMKHEMKH